MKILFEGYMYSDLRVNGLLPIQYFDARYPSPKPIVVGYHYCNEFNCPIIILPKVFLNEKNNFFLCDLDPHLFIEDDYLSKIADEQTKIQLSNFLFECTSWFYFSIKKYHHKYKNSLSLYEDSLNIVDCSNNDNFHTELDLIYSLLKFNKENEDLFLFIKKSKISQNNKIDWNRTIKKSNPIIDSAKTPIYLQTYSKKKQIDFDEDLIVLFLSLLKNIQLKYNIKIKINSYYNILSDRDFSKIKKRGTYYLKRIRYKYFDDRLLFLYKLLYTYFERNEESNIIDNRNEFLIIKDYNIVFQDMVDELLSDSHLNKNLKKHKDNKELDHIYKSVSFIEDDEIYFIGDSKYYKRGNSIEEKSIYKQFTYAKNVIQYNIDLFKEDKNYTRGLRYRDELTEGYNITPNYFVRGTVEHLNYTQPELILDPHQKLENQINFHFPERLFDRDTLIVQSYSINFLYVLWAYIISKTNNNNFKDSAKKIFRESIIEFLETYYDLYTITTSDKVEEFIIKNFYSLNGRIYRPSSFESSNSFILALNENNCPTHFFENISNSGLKIEKYNLK